MSEESLPPFVDTTTASMPVIRGLPVVGALPQVLRRPFNFVEEARQNCGEIYELNLGITKVIMLNHPRHAQYVLRDNVQNYRKTEALTKFARTLVGNGLFVSEGEFWLRQRRLIQPQFHRQRLTALTDLMVEAIEEVFVVWDETRSSDKPFDMVLGFNQMTMRIIVKTLFGFGLTDDEINEVAEAMGFALDYVLTAMMTAGVPDWVPVPGRARFHQSQETFDKVVYRIIDESRGKKQTDNHLLAMLLNAVDEETNEGMTDQQLHDEIATFFLAGYETNAIALSWAVEYLTYHPETLEKLRTEVDSVLGDRRPTFADLPNLPYARMAIQESMRVQPPAAWMSRIAITDDEIDGYPIPAGSMVFLMIYMYHRHPDFWLEPDKFRPERFMPEEAADRHNFAWLPFSAGQRICIGRDFSLMEGQLGLAMLVQRYEIERASKSISRAKLSASLRPRDGVNMYLKSRSK